MAPEVSRLHVHVTGDLVTAPEGALVTQRAEAGDETNPSAVLPRTAGTPRVPVWKIKNNKTLKVLFKKDSRSSMHFHGLCEKKNQDLLSCMK